MVNVKTFLSLQMPKLVNGPMSNNQLKLPDDDDRILCNIFYIIKLQQGASYISKKSLWGTTNIIKRTDIAMEIHKFHT